ncbi:MAG: tRNA lysidine(34) synthetase TilS, partial [Phycisphaerae bacterium]|nr:tRNA lysidine(34) synthetase TilS [Phycisphaerae bacterium]
GADSVALLAVLRELAGRPQRAYRLTAAHLNHGLRDSAAGDADFVAQLARDWSVPCIIERRDVAAEAQRQGKGTEETARMVRYDFLSQAARRAGADYVAVGHHADDNVETILYRIVRGTHIRGLAGIPAARRLEGADVTLVRPLLVRRRDQIEAFCRQAGLTWRTDPTNEDTRFRRNFIRHELLPLLRERLNPRADEAVLRLAGAAGDVDAFLTRLADAALNRATRARGEGSLAISCEALAAEPEVVRTCAMSLAVASVGVPLRAVGLVRLTELTELLGAAGAGAVALPGGYVARRRGDEIAFEAATEAAPAKTPSVPLECPGETLLPDGRRIICEVGAFDPTAFATHCRSRPDGVELVDAEQIRGSLWCRPRAEGDAFVPLGAPGRQTVSDFLTNSKLPRRRREEVLCICDDLGIIYVAPLRIDDRVKITETTRRALKIMLCAQ